MLAPSTPFRGLPIDAKIQNIKGALGSNLKIAVFFKLVKTSPTTPDADLHEVEYHFIRDVRSPKNPKEMLVTCVLCKSVLEDPLKLCGLTKSIGDFSKIFETVRVTANQILWFERIFTSVFPASWYPCFDERSLNLEEERWVTVKKLIPGLMDAGKRLDEEEIAIARERREKEDAARRELEAKRIEEMKKKEGENLALAEREKIARDALATEKRRIMTDNDVRHITVPNSDDPEKLAKFLEDFLNEKKK